MLDQISIRAQRLPAVQVRKYPIRVRHLCVIEIAISKFDFSRQSRRPTARRSADVGGKIVAGVLFGAAVIFMWCWSSGAHLGKSIASTEDARHCHAPLMTRGGALAQ